MLYQFELNPLRSLKPMQKSKFVMATQHHVMKQERILHIDLFQMKYTRFL